MKKCWRTLLLLALILLITSGRAECQGILYRVYGGKNEMTILGSIHVGNKDMDPLGSSILTALHAADTLVFECDTQSEQALSDARELMYYTGKEKLRQHVDRSTLKQLQKTARKTGYPMETFTAMKPWAIVSFLSVHTTAAAMETQDAQDAMQYGVETLIRAQTGTQNVRYLETVRQQLELMDGFSESLQQKMLSAACEAILEPEALTGMDATLAQWPQWWKEGNAYAFAEAYLTDYKQDPEPELANEYHTKLISGRNRSMAQALAQMLEEEKKQSFFVTVGLLHLVLPEDSILFELQEMGYRIEKIGN